MTTYISVCCGATTTTDSNRAGDVWAVCDLCGQPCAANEQPAPDPTRIDEPDATCS